MGDAWGGGMRDPGGGAGFADPWDLWGDASALLSAAGWSLDEKAESELQSILTKAGDELKRAVLAQADEDAPEFHSVLSTKRDEAISNLNRFVTALVAEASSNGEAKVSLDTLRTVLKSLCPVWPICT
jgi:hypothetical protein